MQMSIPSSNSDDRPGYFYDFSEKRRLKQDVSGPSRRNLIQTPNLVSLPARNVHKPKRSSKKKHKDIEKLTYHSWWREGTALGLKRFTTTIEFDLNTYNFNVSFDDKHDPVTVSECKTNKYGPVAPWDLFIGAKIPLLGRNVTLMQGSKATCVWLDNHAKQLDNLRTALKKVYMRIFNS